MVTRNGSPQTRAMSRVHGALRVGRLVRPAECSKCGIVPPLTKAGSSGIQGHHRDYNKPLSVEWLCAKCHRAVTPLPANPGPIMAARGEQNGKAKLTDEIVREIRRSPLNGPALARIYGVDRSLINYVRRGVIWRHVSRLDAPPSTKKGRADV